MYFFHTNVKKGKKYTSGITFFYFETCCIKRGAAFGQYFG